MKKKTELGPTLEELGLAGAEMFECGYVMRGRRGQFGYQVHLNSVDAFYRDDDDEQPRSYRVFVLIPARALDTPQDDA